MLNVSSLLVGGGGFDAEWRGCVNLTLSVFYFINFVRGSVRVHGDRENGSHGQLSIATWLLSFLIIAKTVMLCSSTNIHNSRSPEWLLPHPKLSASAS